jgi:hypothetical protein
LDLVDAQIFYKVHLIEVYSNLNYETIILILVTLVQPKAIVCCKIWSA